MWKLMTRIVDAGKLRSNIAWFVVSAILQGLTLAAMIPFLRSFYSRSGQTQTWLIVVVALGIVTFVIDAVAMFLSYRVSVYVICDSMISSLAEHVLALPLGWFNAQREAAVVNANSKEVNTLSHLASLVIPSLCNAFITPLVVLVATAFVSWPLALIMAAVIVPLYLIWRKMSSATTRANELEDRTSRLAAGRLIEFARLQPVLRATGRVMNWEPVVQALDADSRATLSGLRIKGRPAQGFSLVVNLAFACVLCLGVSMVSGYHLDPISYLVVLAISARMLLPLTEAALLSTELNNAEVAMRSVCEILDARPLPEPDRDEAQVTKGQEIVFDGVTFGYESERRVLDGVELRAQQGKVTALVGPSGAGKSTVLRLAARFWDVDSGSVKIGGVDVRNIPTKELMASISLVFQDVYLFDTTIRENLRLAKPDATDGELEVAARRAQLDRVIDALPNGWETNVGPAGLSLSGGERQRVAIARAFLKDAPILLLDEITSALDSENESAITKVVSELSAGRTVIVVAHRLSTIRDADQVVFLQPGENGAHVAQVGSPSQLAAVPGPFRRFLEAASNASWSIKN